jgi:hypothetical protein
MRCGENCVEGENDPLCSMGIFSRSAKNPSGNCKWVYRGTSTVNPFADCSNFVFIFVNLLEFSECVSNSDSTRLLSILFANDQVPHKIILIW